MPVQPAHIELKGAKRSVKAASMNTPLPRVSADTRRLRHPSRSAAAATGMAPRPRIPIPPASGWKVVIIRDSAKSRGAPSDKLPPRRTPVSGPPPMAKKRGQQRRGRTTREPSLVPARLAREQARQRLPKRLGRQARPLLRQGRGIQSARKYHIGEHTLIGMGRYPLRDHNGQARRKGGFQTRWRLVMRSPSARQASIGQYTSVSCRCAIGTFNSGGGSASSTVQVPALSNSGTSQRPNHDPTCRSVVATTSAKLVQT